MKTNRDDEVIEQLRQEMQEIEIPEGLSPENMMKKLDTVDFLEEKRRMKNKRRKIFITSMVSTAAAILITGTIALNYFGVFGVGNNKDNQVGNDKDTNVEVDTDKDYVVNAFHKIDSYDEIKKKYEENGVGDCIFDIQMNDGIFPENDDIGGIKGETNNSTSGDIEEDYSDTNLRTEGVSEADIVKTDGEYIYSLVSDSDKEIAVILPDGGNTTVVAKFCPLENISRWYENETAADVIETIEEMYIYEKKLIVVCEISEPYYKENNNNYNDNYNYVIDDSIYVGGYFGYRYDSKTIIRTFDVSDVDNIEMVSELAVDGDYSTTRLKDGYLYIMTNREILDSDDVIPEINDEEMISCDDVYMSEYTDYSSYMIISSVDLDDMSKFKDYKAVLQSWESTSYVSGSNIYLYTDLYTANGIKTELMKFAYSEGVIEPDNAVNFAGYLNDTFCIDEYNDYLRLIVTTNDSDGISNDLLVMDSDLVQVGMIRDIAVGETVYSARFMGDIGYFVTFYQTDPLFSVDLSNPVNPTIIGELEIPGFSEYLHPWGDDMLLGIGEEDGEIKLSMFDISNPSNVTEENKVILDDVQYSPALWDYKSVLIDSEKNLIGFSGYAYGVYVYEENGITMIEEREAGYKYLIYQYGEDGFEKKVSMEMESDWIDGYRGLYIGEYVYIVNVFDGVTVLNINDFQEVAEVKFN